LFDFGSSHRRCPGRIASAGYTKLSAQGTHIPRADGGLTAHR